MGEPVPLAPAVVGPQARDLTGGPRRQVEPLMLENVRSRRGSQGTSPPWASARAEVADLYVGDAFACGAPSTREYLGRG